MYTGIGQHFGGMQAFQSTDASGKAGASLPPPLTDPHERNSRMRFFVAQLRSPDGVGMHDPGRRQREASSIRINRPHST